MRIPTGSEIQAAREQRGLTQAELADRADVSQPLIARIESEDVDTTLETLHEVVSALNGSHAEVNHDELEVVVQSALKDARKRAGLSQQELADKADVSQPLISRIERQDLNPRVSTLRSLLEYLDPVPKDSVVGASETGELKSKTSVLEELQSEFDALREPGHLDDTDQPTGSSSSDRGPNCESCGTDLADLSEPNYCPECGSRIETSTS